jgi:hypothetical protein
LQTFRHNISVGQMELAQSINTIGRATVEKGRYAGRRKSLPPEKVAELRQRSGNGEKKAALAREFGISRETLYQYLRQETGAAPPADG